MNGGSSIGSVKRRKNPINIDRSVRDFFKRTNLDATDAQHGGAVQDDVAKEVSSMMWHTAILMEQLLPTSMNP